MNSNPYIENGILDALVIGAGFAGICMGKRLLDAGVVVSPGRIFGPGGEGYLRLALVPTLEETEQAVEVLKACLSPKP